jgi:hypothetical protein
MATATEAEARQAVDMSGVSDSLDFTNIATSFQPKEPGDYPAIITAAEPRIAQQSGNPMIVVEFSFTGEATGKIWQNYVLIPNSLWRLKKDALTIGCDPELFGGVASKEQIISELINRPCVLTLDIENYTTRDGEEASRNVIKRVSAPDALGARKSKKGGF